MSEEIIAPVEEKEVTTTEEVEVKTFKQEDVNNIAARESKKATEKLLKELGIEDFDNAKEGMSKFKQWQEEQKTEAEKQSEQLTGLQQEREQFVSENESLKTQIAAMKHKVKDESIGDVVTLAKTLVGEEVSIEDAIKQVVEKYPHFADVGQAEEQQADKPSFSNGSHQTKNESSDPFAAKLAKYK